MLEFRNATSHCLVFRPPGIREGHPGKAPYGEVAQ
jgi:hypothetical protein